MADLFGDTGNRTVPLAETLRPTTLDDVVGQQHLIGAIGRGDARQLLPRDGRGRV